MAVLGLLLLALSGALTAAIALSNTDSATVEAFGYSLSNLTTGGLFAFGALTGLVFGLGLSMMIAGAARQRARRKIQKSQVKAVRSERETLAEENARLQDELEQARTSSVSKDEVYPADGGRHAADETPTRGIFRR